jgi:hypothetical protein
LIIDEKPSYNEIMRPQTQFLAPDLFKTTDFRSKEKSDFNDNSDMRSWADKQLVYPYNLKPLMQRQSQFKNSISVSKGLRKDQGYLPEL